MRAFSLSAAALGLALAAVLVVHFGAGAVIRSLLAVGWAGFAAVCAIQLALIAVMGIAWWALLPGTSPWAAIWARLVRDSASEVLPLSQIGGYVSGARAIAIAGVSGNEIALALSLLKRARDAVLGLPALGAWQLVESGRLYRRSAADPNGFRAPLETKPRSR